MTTVRDEGSILTQQDPMASAKDVHRILTQARRLIATMYPKPGSALDVVDELVFVAMEKIEKQDGVDR